MASEDETLKTLISKRGKLKAQLTRFNTYLNNFENVHDHIQLKARLEKIELIWHEFENVQSEIELINDNDTQLNERISFENNYFDTIALAQRYLLDNENETKQNVIQDAFQGQVKLPSLSLPNFYGAYDQWMNFYDTFNGLIHNNTLLSNIQKFYYLQSCLKGEAAQVIKNLEISNANYTIAWNILKERFENKRIIVNKHIQSIFDISIIKQESYASLRNFLDTILKNVRSLKSLGQPVDDWNTLLIFILTQKLDFASKKEWEQNTNDSEFPTLEEFTNFLTKRCQLLEKIESNIKTQKTTFKRDIDKNSGNILSHVTTQNISCTFCKENHFNYQCENFLKMPVRERYNETKKFKLCTNCLRPNHVNKDCKSGSCKICQKKHNTALHFENDAQENSKSEIKLNKDNKNVTSTLLVRSNTQSSINTHCMQQKQTQIILSTAVIYIFDKERNPVKCRALLDSGSQSNFITTNLFRKLKLTHTNIDVHVSGISQSLMNISKKTQATIQSMQNEYKATRTFLIIDKITENIPQIPFDISDIRAQKVNLADPCLNEPSTIDILLGADIFWELICIGQINTGKENPILQKTLLGWIVAGCMTSFDNFQNSACHLVINDNDPSTDQMLHKHLERFWKVEEFETKQSCSKEERECEQNFVENFKRDETGRFWVALPLRDNFKMLGDSYASALKRFYHLETKLTQNPTLKTMYVEFMTEYEEMNHMTQITNFDNDDDKLKYYLPHHGVFKDSSTTTKLRVVFDGSAPSNSNISLNDVLKIGPIIQDDLLSIVLRFRQHNYVLAADISKMYRQVNVCEKHRDFQRILWRENSTKKLKHYRLNTVTYGIAPASFLAIRSLHQLAIENKKLYPTTSQIILKDFYVDDLMTGCDTIENAKQLKNELSEILKGGGFELRKWNSNNNDILNDFDTKNNSDSNYYYINNDNDKDCRVLGLLWNPNSDILQYAVNKDQINEKVTKRSILSTVSKIFDPLGLISPVIIVAKMLLQNLWQLKIQWDESVPVDIHTTWNQFRTKLSSINSIQIPRQVTITEYTDVQLHGFCDSSELAFGACIYIRTTDKQGTHTVKLLCAKSRVAPLKTISLPRLELCGAVLLARLVKKATDSINMHFSKIFLWSDSTITLAWINAEPNIWKTFVANRITQIHELTNPDQWRHVNSSNNPADILSRGMNPEILEHCQIWWTGPAFLSKDEHLWPICSGESQLDIPERRQMKHFTFMAKFDTDIFTKYSSITKLQRVFAYVLRFINNVKLSKENRIQGCLTIKELDYALIKLIKMLQEQEFSRELLCLKNSNPIPRKSKILTLNPFLDENNIIRVGGRIGKSRSSYDKKHPMLLPTKHEFTNLVIKNEHIKLLHAGTQAVLASTRHKYWIINGKNAVKRVLRLCITCFKAKPRDVIQPMGDLPEVRLKPNRPFTSSGVDFAGPFLIKDGKLRNRKLVKVYLCLFICLTTKAVHLDITVDLTTESFINVLKRFVSRRGICRDIYSDNGLSFVGANNELKRAFQSVLNFNEDNSQIMIYLNKNCINWHFIPPRAPHFGGLWEAGIKSAKYHMKRILGNSYLTFEELYTVIVQVEAALNSRPLTPLSSDPNDYLALTPSHFLIGDVLTAVPEENVEDIPTNRLTLYKRLRQMFQHFWTRWSNEYLTTLQNRSKWMFQSPHQISTNMLVLLKENNNPPLHWKMGRIVAVHPGKDGVVRVVTVKVRDSVFKRAIHTLCILPIDHNSDNLSL